MGLHTGTNGEGSHFRNADGNVESLAVPGVTVETVTATTGRGRAYIVREGKRTLATLQPKDVADARDAAGLTGKGRTPTHVLVEYAQGLSASRKRSRKVKSADAVAGGSATESE